jgi:hypothetical protein
MLEVLARIRHRRTRRQLSPYLDGMLSDEESRRLEAHLAQCQACRDELAELRATVQSLAELPLAEVPRSFALTAAPRPIEAPQPASRRLELGLGLATAAVAFVLAVVAAGDLLGVPSGEQEEQPAALEMRSLTAATGTGVPEQQMPEVQPSQATAEDKALTEAPTEPPAPAGMGGAPEETTAVPPEANATETVPQMMPGITEPATAAATPPPAPTAPPAATAAPATAPEPETPPLAETPTPEETPPSAFGPVGTPEVAAPAATREAPSATETPPPVGAQIAPSEPEEKPPLEADEAPAEAARESRAAEEEGGPSRETVVRWLEIGLASGVALLFASWVLARRWGRA